MFRIPRRIVLQILPVAVIFIAMMVAAILLGLGEDVLLPVGMSMLSAWCWLQWPRKKLAYVMLATSVVLLTMPGWLGLIIGTLLDENPRDSLRYLLSSLTSLTVSTTMVLLSRLVIGWRMVDDRTEDHVPDLTSRVRIGDLMVATLTTAMSIGLIRAQVTVLQNYYSYYESAPDRLWAEVSQTVALSITATLATMLMMRLAAKRSSLQTFLLFPVLLLVGSVLTTGGYLLAEWVLRSVHESYRSRDFGWTYAAVSIMPFLFVFLTRSTGLCVVGSGSREVTYSSRSGWIVFCTTLTLSVFGLLAWHSLQPYGVTKSRSPVGLHELTEKGWPLSFMASTPDQNGASERIYFRLIVLAFDTIVVIGVSVLIGIGLPCGLYRLSQGPIASLARRTRMPQWLLVGGLLVSLGLIAMGALYGLTARKYAELERQQSVSAPTENAGESGWGSEMKETLRMPLLTGYAIELFEKIEDRWTSRFKTLVTASVDSSLPPDHVSEIMRQPWLRELRLVGEVQLRDQDLDALVANGRLHTFHAANAVLPAETLDQLLQIRTLRVLVLGDQILNASPRLRHSSLRELWCTSRLLQDSDNLPRGLTTLTFDHFAELPSVSIEELNALQELTASCEAGPGMLSIANCGSLESVTLGSIRNAYVVRIAKTPALGYLNVYETQTDRSATNAIGIRKSEIRLFADDSVADLSLNNDNATLTSVEFSNPDILLDASFFPESPNTPEESSDWIVSQLNVLPDDSVRSLEIGNAVITTEVVTQLYRQGRLTALTSFANTTDDAVEKFSGYCNMAQIDFDMPMLSVTNEQFIHVLEAFPNLRSLSLGGKHLTAIDLRRFPKLESLTLHDCPGLDEVRFAAVPPQLMVIPDRTERLLSMSDRSYVVGGLAFDREVLQQLLDTSPKSLTMTSRIEDVESMRGLGLRGCQEVVFEQNVFPDDVIASWKRDSNSRVSILRMNGDDPVPAGLISTLIETLPRCVMLDLGVKRNEDDAMYAYMDRINTVRLNGRLIEAEMLEGISKMEGPIRLYLDHCNLTNGAVAKLNDLPNVVIVSLIGAAYDQEILDAFAEESETIFMR